MIRLGELHGLFNSLVCAQRNQTMDVVDITIHAINVNILRSRILTNMSKDLLADVAVEVWFAILC